MGEEKGQEEKRPCIFHLAKQCDNKKKADERSDLGFFIYTNFPTLFMSQEGGSDNEIVEFSLSVDEDVHAEPHAQGPPA